jgi:hypothetical protein
LSSRRNRLVSPNNRRKSDAVSLLRFWSLDDPSLHQAVYQFGSEAALHAMLKGDALTQLVADFNRDWPDVTRTRELLVLAQEFGK